MLLIAARPAVAVGGGRRAGALPSVPTIKESGFAFDAASWYGIVAPRNLPQPIVDRLHTTLTGTLNASAMQSRLTDLGFEVTVVNYVCVRSGTPQPIIARLNEALVHVLADPALDERMRAAGSSPPQGSTPEELGALLRSESTKWGEVIRRAGIKAG